MNWQKNRLNFKLFMFAALAIVIGGCGVKGDPLPPEKPVEIGRGRPTYKRATEGIKIEKTKKEEEEDER